MKRLNSYQLILLLIIFSISIHCAYSQRPYYTRYHDYGKLAKKSHDLDGALELLNLWKKQPKGIQDIYTEAFNILSSNKRARFTDVAFPINKSINEKDFLQLCKENGITHSGGPMLGNISSSGGTVWLRTLKPARVEIRIKVNEIEEIIYGPVYSSEKTDMTAIVEIDGLLPSTAYPYNVFIDGEPINIKRQSYITTTPQENAPSKMRIAFGSDFHRWGLSYKYLSDNIIARKPLALLLGGGDIAVQDRRNHTGLHRADFLLRDFQPAWKNLVQSIPVYVAWDDHDYFDNDLYNIPEGYTLEDKEAVWGVFKDSWNNPSYGFGEEGKGVFFRTRIGCADVIFLDNRYFREKGSLLGERQLEWLKEQLLDCKGPFIILANGTMWSDYVSDGKDSWGVFDPKGREEIYKLIEENNIKGVLLTSGDRHGARGFKIPRPSGFNFYEFNCASLGGWIGEVPIKAEWDTQLFGIAGEYAFGEFEFDSTLPDPEVTFKLFHGRNGVLLYELTLTRSQLTPNKY